MPTPGNHEEQPNSRATVAAVVVVALLLLAGWWVMSELQKRRDTENCIASGRRDCIPIEQFK